MFSRAKQKMDEKLGKTQKTNYDAEFERQYEMAETMKTHLNSVLNRIEAFLQPDGTIRVSKLVPDKLSKCEQMAQAFSTAGNKFAGSPYGDFLVAMGTSFAEMGDIERRFIEKVDCHILETMRVHINEVWKTLHHEKQKADKKRLDMDAARNKVRTAKSDEVERAEARLKEATADSQKQVEVVQNLLNQYPQHQEDMRQKLKKFVDANIEMHKRALDELQNLLNKY